MYNQFVSNDYYKQLCTTYNIFYSVQTQSIKPKIFLIEYFMKDNRQIWVFWLEKLLTCFAPTYRLTLNPWCVIYY